jgi:hypothetical protein
LTPKERADRAAELLNSEVWAEAYAELTNSLHLRWEGTQPDDWKERERIYDRLQAIKDLKAQFESFQSGALRKEPLT